MPDLLTTRCSLALDLQHHKDDDPAKTLAFALERLAERIRLKRPDAIYGRDAEGKVALDGVGLVVWKMEDPDAAAAPSSIITLDDAGVRHV